MISTILVAGAGIMGSQIAQVLAATGFTVRLHDVAPDVFGAARERIEHGLFGLRAGVARGKLTAAQADAALERITFAGDLAAACNGADLVIEAVPEVLSVKIDVFRRLDELTPPTAVLASNTAGLPVTALAHATANPGRVLGWHWAQPCSVMKLAEIVRHPGSDPLAIEAVVEVARRAGKNPQVINDNPLAWGFVANRIYLQVGREARRIVAEGVATEDQVDAIMRDCFRWPVGPFELSRGAGAERSETARPEDLLNV